jgi:hydroxyacylglutathione hydrolase
MASVPGKTASIVALNSIYLDEFLIPIGQNRPVEGCTAGAPLAETAVLGDGLTPTGMYNRWRPRQSDADGEPMNVDEFMVKGIVVGVFQENCWVIGSRRTREGIVIDPGDEPDRILELARDLGVNVKLIANSHAHVDHILGVPAVQRATGARFLLHPGDDAIARSAPLTAARWLGYTPEPVPDADAPLQDGDTVEVEGLQLRVIHTPGHTPGSVCFYTEGMLFSGDTLFRGSIGRTDLPGGDYSQIMSSIIDRLLPLPDETIVLPGHMLETRIGHERRTNPFVLQELGGSGRR